MNIPGYYYDPGKGRYFKVESSKTAPTDAAWSSDNVKRQKIRDDDTAAAVRYLNIAKSRVRRARVLHDPLTGGFFAREYGAARDDMQAACFAEGLQNKGCISLRSENDGVHVTQMYVSEGDYKTGMCTVYGVKENVRMVSTDVLRDENKRLDHRLIANYRIPGSISLPYWGGPIPTISDMQYHSRSNCILVTQQQPSTRRESAMLWKIKPNAVDSDAEILLQLRLIPHINAPHCVAPAQASSELMCMVGTDVGLVQWEESSGGRYWIDNNSPISSQLNLFRSIFTIEFEPGRVDIFRFGGRPGALFTADTRVDFAKWPHLRLPSTITHLRHLNGGNQVLVAGLENQLGVYDLRFAREHRGTEGDGNKIDIGAVNSAMGSHNNHPRHSQRGAFKGRRRGGRGGKQGGTKTEYGTSHARSEVVAEPVIRFERYRNAAHVNIGFAYDAATGVVAAAHDDIPGTIALYSVRTGWQLRVLDFATEGPGSRGVRSNDTMINLRAGINPYITYTPTRRALPGYGLPIVKSMQFQTFPGDHTPTLFVGGGDKWCSVTAFSFGVNDLEDEA
ncbi:hypothetical protein F4825DRAFT_430709 [Nemania diffusa]|nr:hypothetical protein F4825DRAFT_430709 [Nemania diffusa]